MPIISFSLKYFVYQIYRSLSIIGMYSKCFVSIVHCDLTYPFLFIAVPNLFIVLSNPLF